jgi:hypothetical protein
MDSIIEKCCGLDLHQATLGRKAPEIAAPRIA